MKNIIITILSIFGGIVLGSGIYFVSTKVKCNDAWDRLESFNRCVQTEGCFFDADMFYEGKKAHSFYEKSCGGVSLPQSIEVPKTALPEKA